MIQFALMYLVVGAGLIVVFALGTYTELAMKYGIDVATEAVAIVNEKYCVSGRNWFERIAYFVIGIICWPMRLSEAPELTWRMHEEYIAIESGKKT